MCLLYFGRQFFITSIFAVIVSFILDPFVQFLMRFRCPRSLAAFFVCALALLILYAAGMALYVQASGLVDQLPSIGQHAGDIVDSVRDKIDGIESSASKFIPSRRPPQSLPKVVPRKKTAPLPPPIQEVRIHQENSFIADYIYPRLSSLYDLVLMVSFVPFLVYFLLSWGHHMSRSFLQFFEGESRLIANKSLLSIGEMVRAFVVGNSLLGIMLAVASTLGFWLVSVPFPLLAGPLSGFLSLIPYIGVPLALGPPLIAVLSGDSGLSAVLVVVVMVVVLHLIALNFLYPKIVGARVRLNPLTVTFALMFWSFLWSASGLILAIPLTAALKAVCDNVRGLRPIGRFLGD